MNFYYFGPMIFLVISQALCACSSSCRLDADPFTIWWHRLIYRNLKQLSVSLSDIDNAIHNYGRSSPRVWRIFSKAMEGKSIKMIVIGGSNSAGGGIPDHTQLYHQLFLHWWNSVILPCTGSKLILENLSLGGTGSDFFNLCLQNYLLNVKDPDLVLIELSVNDYGYLYGRTAEPMERLTRRVLSMPSNPLILYITLVDLIEQVNWWKGYPNPRCLNLEDLGQHEIARYYNITILSWRDIVCPMDGEGSKRRIKVKTRMISNDHRHIGIKSHFQIAAMLTRYAQKMFRSLLNPVKRKVSRKIEAIKNIAPLYMKIGVTKPYCWSLITTNWRKPSFSQSLNITVLRHTGFREITPQGPYAKAQMANPGDRNDSFGGWQSEKTGNIIEFSFYLPNLTEKTAKKSSVGLVLRRLQRGSIKVWLVGESERKPVTITGRDYGRRIGSQTRIYFLGVDISSGLKHTLQIKTDSGKAGFKVLVSGIVLGPAGMRDIKQYKPSDTIRKVWSLEDYKKLLIDYTKEKANKNKTNKT